METESGKTGRRKERGQRQKAPQVHTCKVESKNHCLGGEIMSSSFRPNPSISGRENSSRAKVRSADSFSNVSWEGGFSGSGLFKL